MIACPCGLTRTISQFRQLKLVGFQADGEHGLLELRLCTCRSTRALRTIRTPRKSRGTLRHGMRPVAPGVVTRFPERANHSPHDGRTTLADGGSKGNCTWEVLDASELSAVEIESIRLDWESGTSTVERIGEVQS